MAVRISLLSRFDFGALDQGGRSSGDDDDRGEGTFLANKKGYTPIWDGARKRGARSREKMLRPAAKGYNLYLKGKRTREKTGQEAMENGKMRRIAGQN